MEIKPYLRKVQFYETDAMGIVHHANYVRWMEEVRVDFMDQIGYPYAKCTTEDGIDMALTDIRCSYKGMPRFGETVRMEMAITKMTAARITIGYRMYKETDNSLCFEGESVHFFYNNRVGKPCALKRVAPALHSLLSSLCVEDW